MEKTNRLDMKTKIQLGSILQAAKYKKMEDDLKILRKSYFPPTNLYLK